MLTSTLSAWLFHFHTAFKKILRGTLLKSARHQKIFWWSQFEFDLRELDPFLSQFLILPGKFWLKHDSTFSKPNQMNTA